MGTMEVRKKPWERRRRGLSPPGMINGVLRMSIRRLHLSGLTFLIVDLRKYAQL